MGRPKKSQSAVESIDIPGGKNSIDQNELINKLMMKINELENKINFQGREKTVDVIEDEDDEINSIDIRPDMYIKVISLTPYMLVLTTERGGRGKFFRFPTFGSTKRILYGDLINILEVNRTFLDDGLFYIADKRVIRKNGLNDVYEKLLTKEKIESILEGRSEDVMSLFKSANKRQQEMICDMFVEKLRNNPDSVDLNLIDKISRASGIKIQEIAEDAIGFEDAVKEEQD